MQNKPGRPKLQHTAKQRTIRLTDSEYTQFKLMGGAAWLRKLLNTTERLIK